MLENFRDFEATDPFGQTWQVRFLWQQNAISIRHFDGVDVKFRVTGPDGPMEKVVALRHPLLLELSRKTGHPLTDAWVSRLGAAHLRHMIETWEDMEKTLVTPAMEDLERYDRTLEQRAPVAR